MGLDKVAGYFTDERIDLETASTTASSPRGDALSFCMCEVVEQFFVGDDVQDGENTDDAADVELLSMFDCVEDLRNMVVHRKSHRDRVGEQQVDNMTEEEEDEEEVFILIFKSPTKNAR